MTTVGGFLLKDLRSGLVELCFQVDFSRMKRSAVKRRASAWQMDWMIGLFLISCFFETEWKPIFRHDVTLKSPCQTTFQDFFLYLLAAPVIFSLEVRIMSKAFGKIFTVLIRCKKVIYSKTWSTPCVRGLSRRIRLVRLLQRTGPWAKLTLPGSEASFRSHCDDARGFLCQPSERFNAWDLTWWTWSNGLKISQEKRQRHEEAQ